MPDRRATISPMALPIHLDAPTALEFFATLVADDASFSLLEAAACVAQDEYPRLDIQELLSQVDTLALRLSRRVPADAAPLQRMRLLNQYFFHELGFAGNVNDYYDARNSYLPDVLTTRRGIPITLALVYMELATQIGLTALGVSFPGHFLVKLRMPRGEAVIDPFTGRSLSRDELEERLAPFRQQRGLRGDLDAPLALFLQPAPSREVIARLLRNLKAIHRAAGDWVRLLAVQERLVVLLPDAWDERRDRGLVLADLGDLGHARMDLAAYLQHCPHAADAAAMQRRLHHWRHRGGPSAS
jgi:regulator of sirC expression with transglutaminase-like and TPR domain